MKHRNVEDGYCAAMEEINRRRAEFYQPDNNEVIRRIEDRELRKEIHDAINELPDKCKEVFKLSYLHDMKNKEIADVLGVSLRTVEAHMYKALKFLRNRLGSSLVHSPLIFIAIKDKCFWVFNCITYMKEKKMRNLSEEIINKYLTGQCSEEELIEVNAWISESDENARQLFRMEEIYHLGKFDHYADEQRMANAEKRLYKQAVRREKEEQIKVLHMHRWMRYAASPCRRFTNGRMEPDIGSIKPDRSIRCW